MSAHAAFALISSTGLPPRRAGVRRGRLVAAGGIDLYVETFGRDDAAAIVLLHGGLGSIHAFGALLPALARSRRVIAVELQGHGRTADVARPLRYEQLADDVAALLATLGIERADVFGFCLGGGVALQVAIRHPAAVRSVIVAGAPFRRDGWSEPALATMAALDAGALAGSPQHTDYLRLAPRPGHWPVLVDKLRALLAEPYDWSDGVAAIAAPALILAGDQGRVQPAHAVAMFEHVGSAIDPARDRAQLVVLPATAHACVLARSDLVAPIVAGFLAGAERFVAPPVR
jgi:pimeloyl-ACP methyl ester carboxylesterase